MDFYWDQITKSGFSSRTDHIIISNLSLWVIIKLGKQSAKTPPPPPLRIHGAVCEFSVAPCFHKFLIWQWDAQSLLFHFGQVCFVPMAFKINGFCWVLPIDRGILLEAWVLQKYVAPYQKGLLQRLGKCVEK